MQAQRPVRIHHALGLAGGARRVTHPRRLPLVNLGEVVRGIGEREHVLVIARARRQRRAGGPDDDHVLDGRALPELEEQGQQRLVHDAGAVAGVRRDVRQVVGVQAEVERVQHHAARRHAVVRLQVLRAVPRERGHAIAVTEPERPQPTRQLPRPGHDGTVVGAMQRTIGAPRDHGLAGEERLGAPQDDGQHERKVHHLAGEHWGAPWQIRKRLTYAIPAPCPAWATCARSSPAAPAAPAATRQSRQ